MLNPKSKIEIRNFTFLTCSLLTVKTFHQGGLLAIRNMPNFSIFAQEGGGAAPASKSGKPKGRPASAGAKRSGGKPASGLAIAKSNTKNAGRAAALRQFYGDIEVSSKPNYSTMSKEQILGELNDAKKKNALLEKQSSHLKTENQRLNAETSKMQGRIDRLLHEGASKGGNSASAGAGTSASSRKEIEKSVLVRHLKQGIIALRASLAERDGELESYKRSTKSSNINELITEREEMYFETKRLRSVVSNLRDDLQDAKSGAGKGGARLGMAKGGQSQVEQDLRREVATMQAGYQDMLKAMQGQMPEPEARIKQTSIKQNQSQQSQQQRGQFTTQSPPGPGSPHRPQSAVPKIKSQSQSKSPRTGTDLELESDVAPISPSLKQKEKNNKNNSLFTDNSKRPQVGALPEIPAFKSDFNSNSNPARAGAGGGKQQQSQQQQASEMASPGGRAPAVSRPQLEVVTNKTTPPIHVEKVEKVEKNGEKKVDSPESQPQAPAARPVGAVSPVRPRATVAEISRKPSSLEHKEDDNDIESVCVFKTGERVEGQYHNGEKWYAATVKAVNAGLIHLLYDDGEEERNMPPHRLRALAGLGAGASPISPIRSPIASPRRNNNNKNKNKPSNAVDGVSKAGKYAVGLTVEALYYNGTTYYSAKVNKVNTTSGGKYTYDLQYDDGDREKNVLESKIRLPGQQQEVEEEDEEIGEPVAVTVGASEAKSKDIKAVPAPVQDAKKKQHQQQQPIATAHVTTSASTAKSLSELALSVRAAAREILHGEGEYVQAFASMAGKIVGQINASSSAGLSPFREFVEDCLGRVLSTRELASLYVIVRRLICLYLED